VYLLVFVVLALIGVLLALFPFSNIVLSFFFAFPFTRFLYDLGAIEETARINRRYVLAIVLNFGLLSVLTYFFFTCLSRRYTAPLVYGFFIGSVQLIRTLFAGMTSEMVQDYVNLNKSDFKNRLFAKSLLSGGFHEVWNLNRELSKTPMHTTVKNFYDVNELAEETVSKFRSRDESLGPGPEHGTFRG